MANKIISTDKHDKSIITSLSIKQHEGNNFLLYVVHVVPTFRLKEHKNMPEIKINKIYFRFFKSYPVLRFTYLRI